MLQYNQDVTDIIDSDFYIINKEQLYMNPFNRQKKVAVDELQYLQPHTSELP